MCLSAIMNDDAGEDKSQDLASGKMKMCIVHFALDQFVMESCVTSDECLNQ